MRISSSSHKRVRRILLGSFFLLALAAVSAVVLILQRGNTDDIDKTKMLFNEVSYDDIFNNDDLHVCSFYLNADNEVYSVHSKDMSLKYKRFVWSFLEQLSFKESFTFPTHPALIKAGSVPYVEIPSGTYMVRVQLHEKGNIEILFSQDETVVKAERYTSDETVFYEFLAEMGLFYDD